MAVDASRAPAFRLREDELPPELILSIERILDLHAHADADPLDRLINDFNPIGVLNDYFPNGAHIPLYSAVIRYSLAVPLQRLPSARWKPYRHVLRRTSERCRMR